MTTPDTRLATPHRTCIGCRQARPQSELVRCVLGSPNGSHQGVHVSRTAAGRGAWLCSMKCYETAMQRKAFDRSWKRSVSPAAVVALGDSLRTVFHAQLNDTDMKESSVVGIAPGGLTSTKG